MLYIPVKYLRPGMTLARDLPSDLFHLSLATCGQELSERLIDRLKEHHVKGAYVESNFCNDIDSAEFIEPKFKQEMLCSIKKQFDDYAQHALPSGNAFRSIASSATDLVTYVLSKDEFLLNVIDIRDYDSYTYSHSMFVGLISVLIGIKLNLSNASLVELAMSGLLHDVGKLDIDVDLINKPGQLTSEEFAILQMHPVYAVQRLQENCLFSYSVLRGIESHHEKYNGTGYPKHLAGKKIPLYGRIMALADVYDALTSERSYRNAWTSGQAIEYMMSCSDTHFDHELLKVFLDVVTAYPVGTMVRLSNECLAVVTRNTPGQTLRPAIRMLYPPDIANTEIDLATDRNYFNVTVLDVVEDSRELPDSIFS